MCLHGKSYHELVHEEPDRAKVDQEPKSASDEERLISAVQALRMTQPDSTAKELHATLSAGDWPDVSISEVKKAAAKAAKQTKKKPTGSRRQVEILRIKEAMLVGVRGT